MTATFAPSCAAASAACVPAWAAAHHHDVEALRLFDVGVGDLGRASQPILVAHVIGRTRDRRVGGRRVAVLSRRGRRLRRASVSPAIAPRTPALAAPTKKFLRESSMFPTSFALCFVPCDPIFARTDARFHPKKR